MAGVRRLLRADSDGWGVSATIGLVLSISSVSFSSRCPLRNISKCFISQWRVGRRARWKSLRWAEQIKFSVLERLTFVAWERLCMCRCRPIRRVSIQFSLIGIVTLTFSSFYLLSIFLFDKAAKQGPLRWTPHSYLSRSITRPCPRSFPGRLRDHKPTTPVSLLIYQWHHYICLIVTIFALFLQFTHKRVQRKLF